MTKDPIDTLQERLGYRFKDKDRLLKALTHSSTGTGKNYERLEFLGDRVLGLVMAQLIFEEFPEEHEGDLAKRHAALVQGQTLARIAREIDLGEAMQLSDAERASGGADNDHILADGVEGVLGALYLDAGLEACQRVLKELFGDTLYVMVKPPQDPKTALQEWAQARALPLPNYELVGKEGPDHAPTFAVRVSVEGFPPWTCQGPSRRVTEKQAAGMLLAHLEEMEALDSHE